ncbi:60s ribosomal protein L28 [Cryptosporidium ubiquitum]|uniref:60s ribosomal protein L28 n=1 Tax=Cryptosporidium ubiquitum TaxID=857276 RepID=A0A1J4MDD8_9CRYT|nr:60s ribosomal protein L28 [Cryptosporidium ubiquitum]OII72248.1 60s ribosomal protein L28 [Cryptosporidium ubiquitum]
MFSTELLWQCVKKNTSFIKKNNGFTFTSEPFNIMNLNTLKYSGLAARRSIGMELVPNSNGKLVKNTKIIKKNSGSSTIRCPKKFTSKVNLSNDFKQAKKTIKNQVLARPDLKNAAIIRYRKIQKAKC